MPQRLNYAPKPAALCTMRRPEMTHSVATTHFTQLFCQHREGGGVTNSDVLSFTTRGQQAQALFDVYRALYVSGAEAFYATITSHRFDG